MAVTLTRTVTLTTQECIVCGVSFALPETMLEQARKCGGWFYCPNGHSQGWNKRDSTSHTDTLDAEIARLKSSLEYKDAQIEKEKRKTATAKGQLTKERNRTANGVCPCCRRSFQNLQRHMTTQHPTFSPSGNPTTAETASSNDKQ